MKEIDQILQVQLNDIKEQGTYKSERIIETAQESEINVNGKKVLNFCANNYLGLANHPDLISAAKNALDDYGFGMASVRFICGTQDIHKVLEKTIAKFKYFDTITKRVYYEKVFNDFNIPNTQNKSNKKYTVNISFFRKQLLILC